MIATLALFLSAAASPPVPRATAVAEARITILRPYRAEQDNWAPEQKPNQREINRREGNEQIVRLRLTEFQ